MNGTLKYGRKEARSPVQAADAFSPWALTGATEMSEFRKTEVLESAWRHTQRYFQSQSVVTTAYFVLSVLVCGKLQMKGIEVSALPSSTGAESDSYLPRGMSAG